MRKLATLLLACVPLLASVQATAAGPEGDCGFSKFHPARVVDFAEVGAANQVKPQYPPAANAKGLSGTVTVRMLINKQGLVERTCPVYVTGQPKPDRSLVVMAEAAALQWTFPPNFGVEPRGGIRFEYIETDVVFNFVPAEPKKDDSKHQ